ncbi:MAG: putative Ser/Thr protein kinase/tetratricopeptide (TPR) repeat protein [Bradymonadia bacterium]
MSADETELGAPLGATRTGLPKRINHYRIEGKLGAGGMGEVYGAYDERLHRDVALKVLRGGRQHDDEARARFWREARVLAALNHPSIVRVYEFGETDDGELFLAMAFIPGQPLIRGSGSVETVSDALSAIRDVADGLAEAHRNGVVHRDIKPTNVIVGDDGAVVLIDFGIAHARHDGRDTMTSTGAALGSPAYMAPEQLRGEEVTPSADVYGCGVVLFELFTGRRPFIASSAFATAIAVEAGDRPALRDLRDDLPDAVVNLVEDCLSLDAEQRPQDGAALRDRLDVILETGAGGELPERAPTPRIGAGKALRPRPTPSSWPRVAIALVCVVAVGVTALWLRPAPATDTPPIPVWEERPERPVIAFAADDDEELAGVSELVAETARVALDDSTTRWIAWPEPPTDAFIAFAASPHQHSPSPLRLDALVFIQTHIVESERALELTVRAETPGGEPIDAWTIRTPSHSPIEAGLLLADSVAEWLRHDRVQGLPPTRSAEALSLYLSVRDAHLDGDDSIRERIATALTYDANFGAAAVEQAETYRTGGTLDRIAPFVSQVLQEPVPQRQEQLLQGLRAIGEGDNRAAYNAFTGLLDNRLYDRRALHLLLALPDYDASLIGRSEQAEFARQLLHVVPGDTIAASRFVHVFPWTERAEIERALETLGAFDALGDARQEIDSEIALLAGDYEEAIEGFEAALIESPRARHATHQHAAAMILDGQCEEAASSLYRWIRNTEASSDGGDLTSAYSLAVQALVCEGQFDAAERALESVHEGAPDWNEYKQQALLLMVARGVSPEVISRIAQELLEDAEWGTDEISVLQIVAVSEMSPERLRALAEQARRRSLNSESTLEEQRGFEIASRSLAAFAALHDGESCETAVLPALQQNIGAPADDITDGDMVRRVDARVALAHAAERCGLAEAATLWRQVRDARYGRLYRAASTLLAQRRLAALQATNRLRTETPEER